MSSDRQLPPRGALEKSPAQLDADVRKVMEEMLVHERAGTVGGPAWRALGERLDALLEEDDKAFRRLVSQSASAARWDIRFKVSETFRSWVLALTCLSPAITAIILMLAGIVPRDQGLPPLIALGVFQALFLYAALFETHPRRGGINQSAEIESRKRSIEAQFMEIKRRRRTVVWYCAAVVFAVLALTIVMVR